MEVKQENSHKETRRFPAEDEDETEATTLPAPQIMALVRRVKALIDKADKAADKAEQLYKSAGLTIKEIKDKCPKDWETIVRDECGLGRSRAYELIAIADGRTTLEKVRDNTNERKKVHRAKSESVPERTEQGPESLPPPVAEVADDSPGTEDRDSEIAPPAVIEDNVLHTLDRTNEHARIFKKFFKLSTFDREAEQRISTAIDRTIDKLRSAQATLRTRDNGLGDLR